MVRRHVAREQAQDVMLAYQFHYSVLLQLLRVRVCVCVHVCVCIRARVDRDQVLQEKRGLQEREADADANWRTSSMWSKIVER